MASLSTSSAPTFTSFFSPIPQEPVVQQKTSKTSTISKFVRIIPFNGDFLMDSEKRCIQCSRATTIVELALFILNRVKQTGQIGSKNVNVSDFSFELSSPTITDLNSTVDSHNTARFFEFKMVKKLSISTFETFKEQIHKEQNLMIPENLIPMSKWGEMINAIINAETHLETLRTSRAQTWNITSCNELMSKLDSSITSLSDVISRSTAIKESASKAENLSRLLRIPMQTLSICLKSEYIWVKIQPTLQASVSSLPIVLMPLIRDYLDGDIPVGNVEEIPYSQEEGSEAFTVNYGTLSSFGIFSIK